MMDKMMINLSIMKTELRSCRYTMEEIRSGMKIVEFKYEG